MVSLVQLVEHQIVVLGVMGSSPIGYPKKREKQLLLSLFGYGAGWRLPQFTDVIPAAGRRSILIGSLT